MLSQQSADLRATHDADGPDGPASCSRWYVATSCLGQQPGSGQVTVALTVRPRVQAVCLLRCRCLGSCQRAPLPLCSVWPQYLGSEGSLACCPPPSESHFHSLQLHPKLAAGGLAMRLLGFTLGPMPHLSGLARELVYSRHFLASGVPYPSFFLASASGVASTEHGELGIDQSPSPSILLLLLPPPPLSNYLRYNSAVPSTLWAETRVCAA